MSTIKPDENNEAIFRDCLSEVIISALEKSEAANKKQAKRGKKRREMRRGVSSAAEPDVQSNAAEDMADFVQYLASEMFSCLPEELQTLNYSTTVSDPETTESFLSSDGIESLSSSMPASATDSLQAYGLPDIISVLNAILPSYVAATAAPPPIWVSTRTTACELCERDWVPLTYHHLIPRSTHDRALKRGWHEEWELNKVAWICSACHRCVHRVTTNEDLAQNWHTVEKLLTREDIQSFIRWVGGVRWKKR